MSKSLKRGLFLTDFRKKYGKKYISVLQAIVKRSIDNGVEVISYNELKL